MWNAVAGANAWRGLRGCSREFVVDRGMDDAANWTLVQAEWTISGGVATKVVSAATADLSMSKQMYRFYLIVFSGDLVRTAGNFTCGINGTGFSSASLTASQKIYLTLQTYGSGSAPTGVRFRGATTATGTLDNVSAREIPW